MDSATIITIVSLALVLVVTGMIAFLMSSSKSKQKNRMMNVIRGSAVDDKNKKTSSLDARREALARKLKERSEPEGEEKKKNLSESLMQANLDISVKKFWIFSFLFSVVLTVAVYLAGYNLFVVIMAAIIGLFGIPRLYLRHVIKKRQKKFLTDFADSLEAMTRLLRAGMPVSEAIKMVAREFVGPVGEEMGRIFDQQKIGVSLPDAVANCAKRIPIPEVQMFTTAVTIQAQTGSSLSEILEGLAKVIRARFKLRRKVQALSSEAKSSAIIIGALPVFVASAMYFINPEYIEILFIDPTGKFMLGIAFFWMFCGAMIMRQMINFKV